MECVVTAETLDRTGVEMEALTAVSIALLTIYDMCKAVDRGMSIADIRLLEKQGGRSGHWQAASLGCPSEITPACGNVSGKLSSHICIVDPSVI